MYLRHYVNDKRVCMHLYVSSWVYERAIKILSLSLSLSSNFSTRNDDDNASFDIDARDRKPVWIVGSLLSFFLYAGGMYTL